LQARDPVAGLRQTLPRSVLKLAVHRPTCLIAAAMT
jgi:hypothetical protein